MIKLEFGEFAVNMRDPAALDAALLGDVSGGYDVIEGESSAGQVNYAVMGGANPTRVRLYGAFDPTGTDPGPASTVNQLEIYVDASFAQSRLIVTQLPNVSFDSVFDGFLVGGDITALFAGQPVEIHGSNGFGDTLEGGSLGDALLGFGGRDRLFGLVGNDVLRGHGGADTLNGGAGIDTMYGGGGDDLYYVNSAADRAIEGADGGTDTVLSTVTATLDAGVERLTLSGTAAINGAGNSGANVITGNAGNNLLEGKGGADTLNGGGGADRLAWSSADTFNGGSGGGDMLLVQGSGVVITLYSLPNSKIRNIEIINLTGSGDNVLNLNVDEVLAISTTSNTLRVMGNAGDSIQISDGWTQGNDLVIGANTYARFTQAGATLLVDTDISQGT